MAWQAKLDKDVSATDDGGIAASFSYYDTATPANILHSHLFTFEPNATMAQMRAAVIAEGQAARDAFQKAATLATQFPVGTTVNIP